mmetsp:Transcript_108520/g.242022  ORF Transcript_108520/g.242022 Transcript_108520/m.242022 type:complete len:741 (-) Transcript_108520:71-2293(-)
MGTRQSCSKACSNCAADCTRSGNAEDFDENERPGGDPAGATFGETLEDLNSLDRNLMLFCAAENLAAVRWLTLQLGAHWDAFDANGTTCLHVACRAGSLPVVAEMMQYKELVQAVDNAGWTPLHIAVLMGRQQVVIRLLQAEASLRVRNSKGQLPVELCADSGTHEAIRSFELHAKEAPGRPWQFGSKDAGPGEENVGSQLQYEPFFVPRQPLIRSHQYKKEFQRIGMLIFNQQPGFGLAFLVASGVSRDYPMDMSTFLRRSKVDIKQVGAFLGEAFSLSHTIRLEFMNSVMLQGTGVVSALIQIFHMLQLPDDLQKINRLLHSIARIWWRQHERIVKDSMSGQSNRSALDLGDGGLLHRPQLYLTEELVGLELKQYLTSYEALHQIMFSTVLLHSFMYNDGTGPRKELDFAMWKKLNVGIESEGSEVPEHVQLQIYILVCKAFIPELALAMSGGEADQGGGCDPDAVAESSRLPFLSGHAAAQGWTQMVGGGFPRPSGLAGARTVTYHQVSGIFSEVTQNTKTSGLPRSPLAAAGEGASAGAAVPAPRRDDFAWLSLCYTLLFFSTSFGCAPYAFVQVKTLCIAKLDEENYVLSLVSAPEADSDADLDRAGGARSRSPSPEAVQGGPPSTITIVLLLPDGRWQELGLQQLELRFPSLQELKIWSSHLGGAAPSPPQSTPQAFPPRPLAGQQLDVIASQLGPRPLAARPPMASPPVVMPCKDSESTKDPLEDNHSIVLTA